MPADSADQVYYDDCMWNAHEFLLPEHLYSEVVKEHENVAIPCWSVGRLIEIYAICTGISLFELPIDDNLIETIVDVIEWNKLNFSKLEE